MLIKKKKKNLISWDVICKSKVEGDLMLKKISLKICDLLDFFKSKLCFLESDYYEP